MHNHNRTARFAATATGAAILAASAAAVIIAGHQDAPHAILTGTLALGVLVGAGTVGRAWGQSRIGLALAIAAALICGEAFNLIATADRIVAEREAGQAKVKAEAGAHRHASAELVKAQAALDKANDAAVTEAAKPGCKQNCRALIEAQVINAKTALDRARQLYTANPEPTASGSPLADRLGVAPWVIDLMIAGLLSLGANGLAAGLIAYGTHGQPGQLPATEGKVAASVPAPTKPRGKGRRGATEKDAKVVGFVTAYRTRHGKSPSIPDMIAAFPGMATSTAQRYRRTDGGNGSKVATLRVA